MARDLTLVIGGLLIELKASLTEIKPNILGKLTAFLQSVCVVTVFLQWHVTYIFWVLALIAATVSGVIYIMEGIKVLNDGSH